MPRFFVNQALEVGQHFALPTKTSHHAMRTLRLVENDIVTVFNGKGGEYHARLYFKDKHSWVEIQRFDPREAELSGCLHLVQGLVSNEKMDWIIEKAVELGIQHIHPIKAERSIIKLNEEKVTKRLSHWQAIIESAAEQSGRNRLPMLHTPCTLQHYFQESTHSNSPVQLLCHPQASASLNETLQTYPSNALAFLIGPEGGWSPKEELLAQQSGALAIRFGARVLRTETAGIALCAASTSLLNWD